MSVLKNIQLTKKQKGLLVGATSLLGAAAIATPIAVVYAQKQQEDKWPTIVDEFDAEYGITNNTYLDMKKELREKYEDHLINDLWYDEETVKLKMAELDDQLKFFDDEFEEMLEEDEEVDYSTLTQVLADFARKNYGISLQRPSTMTYDDIREYYLGLKTSSYLYMKSIDVDDDDIWKRLAKSEEKYTQIINDLQKKYPDDVLSAWTEGSTLLYDCFNADNKFAALMSAQNKLRDFVDSYNVTYRENAKVDNTFYSDLVQNLEVGAPIDYNVMDTIFVFTEKATNTEVPFTYTSLIPNYTIVPVLHAKYIGANNPDRKDPVTNTNIEEQTNTTNTYTLAIDWQVTCNSYVQNHYVPMSNEVDEDIVAHLRGDSEAATRGEYFDGDPIENIKHCEILYPQYEVRASKPQEQRNLLENYFTLRQPKARNNGLTQYDAQLIWPKEPDQIHYEAFWDGVSTDTLKDITKAEITEEGLANAGLKVRVDKIATHREMGEEVALADLLPNLGKYWETYDVNLKPEELFIKYCSIGGTVTLENHPEVKEDGIYTVSTSLFTKYRNEFNFNKDESCVALGEWTSVIKSKISQEFFEQAANNYNKVREKYSIYFDGDVLGGFDTTVADYFFKMSTSVAYDAMAIASLAAELFICFILVEVKEIALISICTALLISHSSLLALEIATWNTNFFVPYVTFKSNLKSLSKQTPYKVIADKLESDKIIFPIWDMKTKDYTYDDDFKNKKNQFDLEVKRLTFNGAVLEYCDFYSGAVNYDVDPKTPLDSRIIAFNEAAKKYHVTPDDIIKLFSLFDEGDRMFDFLKDLEDKKQLLSMTVEGFLWDIKPYFGKMAGIIKKASWWVKYLNIGVKQILSYIKCDDYEVMKENWE